MQNQKIDAQKMQITIMTPESEPISLLCTSVHLSVCDTKNGNGGGSYGIRYGHAPSIFALKKGPLEVIDESVVFREICDDGFVKVEENQITVVTEHIFYKQVKKEAK